VGKEALDKTVEYMEKMAAFKAEGTSDEDKLAWVSDYKKTMEAQDQLPLLFQTMTVRAHSTWPANTPGSALSYTRHAISADVLRRCVGASGSARQRTS
jgi:hypothetical protein